MDRSKSKTLLLIADANPENVSVLKTMRADDFDINVATDGVGTIRLASSADGFGLDACALKKSGGRKLLSAP